MAIVRDDGWKAKGASVTVEELEKVEDDSSTSYKDFHRYLDERAMIDEYDEDIVKDKRIKRYLITNARMLLLTLQSLSKSETATGTYLRSSSPRQIIMRCRYCLTPACS